MRVSCPLLLAAAAVVAVSLQLPAQSRPKSPAPSVPFTVVYVPMAAAMAGMGPLTGLTAPAKAPPAKRHGASSKIFIFENFDCYALRVYHFSRVSPYSDVMKRKGYSTCEPAQLFHTSTVRKPPK